ncbi:MAG: hypothetical protein HQM14_07085 [SAR324 cluster bacterium]|nr:hypothetical protein [SAR324 cluster bacterium]
MFVRFTSLSISFIVRVDDAQDNNISSEGTPYISRIILYNELSDLMEAIFGISQYLVPYSFIVQDIMVSEVDVKQTITASTPEGTTIDYPAGSKLYLKLAFEQEEYGLTLRVGGFFDAEDWLFDLQAGQFDAVYSKPSFIPESVIFKEVESNRQLIGMPELDISGNAAAARFEIDTEYIVAFLYYKTENGDGSMDVSDSTLKGLDFRSTHSHITLSYKITEYFHLALNSTTTQRNVSGGDYSFIDDYSDEISITNIMVRLVW